MDDESELAGVLSHEIEHVCRKHALTSIQRARALEGLGEIADVTLKSKDKKNFKNAISGLQTILFDKGLDKNMEYEADRRALNLAYRTGYDPEGLIRVLYKLKAKEDHSTTMGSWFSTHPPINLRLEETQSEMSKYSDSRAMARSKKRFLWYKKRLKA
jgi:predicted Zn-dependent protease